MAFLTPNVGEQIVLEALVNKTAPQNLVLRLFQNNITPGETDTAGTYTEATFTGYTSITLTGATWTYANPTVSYPEQTFTSTAGSQSQPIYGYYLTQLASGILVLAERFSGAPVTIINNGDTIKVTPTISAD
jgi:membrane peptidoglycan carboxypeptidase